MDAFTEKLSLARAVAMKTKGKRRLVFCIIIALILPFSIIGYFIAIVGQTGLSPGLFLAGFVLPHGIFEIPAIIITGALIIRLGLTLVTPNKNYTIGEAWIRTLADWSRLILFLVIPLLVVAAFLEVFVTPRIALALFGG